MRRAVILVCLLSLISIHPAIAEESIKVLMLNGPDAVLPAGDAEMLGRVEGEIIFDGHLYTGSLEVRSDGKGLYIINEIPLERYVEGVVASESGEGWELEALKAQAVVSRTYAIYNREHMRGRGYHITSSIRDQLYRETEADPLVSRAVKETEGEILLYNNRPIKAYYHSICMGKTEVPEEVWGDSYPYLVSVDCNAKDTPYDSWYRRVSLEDLEDLVGVRGIGDIRISSYTVTGRVKTLEIMTVDHSSITLRATDLRRLLGYRRLPSTDFSLRIDDGGVVFEGRGWGHGVGLCQWGAKRMAEEGKTYREILEHFYPGTTLRRMRGG